MTLQKVQSVPFGQYWADLREVLPMKVKLKVNLTYPMHFMMENDIDVISFFSYK